MSSVDFGVLGFCFLIPEPLYLRISAGCMAQQIHSSEQLLSITCGDSNPRTTSLINVTGKLESKYLMK